MRWMYGITTVPERRETLLPKTLESLAKAGFDCPRIFVDSCEDATPFSSLGLQVVPHWPRIRVFGTWWLALWELYTRDSLADAYAIFQDDLLCVGNLKAYLEQCKWPDQGYLNLYSFPDTIKQADGAKGWFKTSQRGKGALGLVFPREATVTLLSSKWVAMRMQEPVRGWRSVDGCVVTALKLEGWKEWAHNPSLLQHTGEVSSFDKRLHNNDGYHTEYPKHVWPSDKAADTFPGETFDALSLLEHR